MCASVQLCVCHDDAVVFLISLDLVFQCCNQLPRHSYHQFISACKDHVVLCALHCDRCSSRCELVAYNEFV